MKRLALIALLVLAASCAVQKPQAPTVIVRDSVVFRDRLVTDTAFVEIPTIIEKNITRDTASHLENTYAKSDAVVYGGFLAHSLETKPQTIKAPVTVTVHDTLIVQKEAEIQTQTVEVEKSLSWWQRLRIGAFWWLLALALVGWRREIIAGVKLLIKLF